MNVIDFEIAFDMANSLGDNDTLFATISGVKSIAISNRYLDFDIVNPDIEDGPHKVNVINRNYDSLVAVFYAEDVKVLHIG